ncbi:MAG: imidazole glycerol phosphate synthase cyclase subunit, partial [Alphaproteobacteria bacterium]
MTVRLIPRLDIKAPNLVKGIHLEGLRPLGDPAQFARFYYESGADELLYMDAVATLYERNSLLDIVSRTSSEIFIPLCVGGGIRSVADIQAVLRAGADKVSLNTAAIRNPDFVRDAAERFGASTIVISLETIRQPDGSHVCFTDCGRERTDKEAVSWARQVESLGAGEIHLTSVDREGTGRGYDLDLVRSVAEAVSIPVVACGGAGTVEHVVEALRDGRADAVAAASLFHYHTIKAVDVGHRTRHAHYA